MSRKDRFLMRFWIVIAVAALILNQITILSDQSKTMPVSSHPYLAAVDIVLAILFILFVVWGARMFWRLLNEKVESIERTEK